MRSTTRIAPGQNVLTPHERDLKLLLDGLYAQYDFKARVAHDPISFPKRYDDRRDIEIVGLISALFAYGQAGVFMKALEKIFSRMGARPSEFIAGFNPKRHGRLFAGIKYRFNTESDIISLIYILSAIVRKHGTIENAFGFDGSIEGSIKRFASEVMNINTKEIYGENIKPPGLRQFFPSPAQGGASKRICLYLRWMVRDRDIDFGLWKSIPKDRLVIPLDTHIARISRCLALTARKSNDWRTAIEITDALRRLDPADPLKYDFALCHRGISGICSSNACSECTLKEAHS